MEHNHRMLDLLLLGEDTCALVGATAGTFIRAMDDLRASAGAELAAGDDFITATRRVLEEVSRNAQRGEALPGYKRWFDGGTVAVRLGDDSVLVGIRPRTLFSLSQRYYPIGLRDSWTPRNEREVTGALLRTTPVFGDIGIAVEKREPSRGNAYWEFHLPPDAGGA